MEEKIFWRRAADYGLIVGLAVFAVNLAGLLLGFDDNAALSEGLLLAVIVGGIVLSARRNMALDYPDGGYTYARSLGFALALMFFAAVAAGTGDYLLRAWIAPEHYMQQFEQMLQRLEDSGVAVSEQMRQALDAAPQMMRNPLMLILSEIINLGLKGGAAGALLAVYLRNGTSSQNNTDNDRKQQM